VDVRGDSLAHASARYERKRANRAKHLRRLRLLAWATRRAKAVNRLTEPIEPEKT
jgi:hypothetical protein